MERLEAPIQPDTAPHEYKPRGCQAVSHKMEPHLFRSCFLEKIGGIKRKASGERRIQSLFFPSIHPIKLVFFVINNQ
jgi:hypothetical protein